MANIVWTCWTTLGKAKIRLSERRYNQTQSASHRADVLPIFALMRAFISMVSLCEQCCSLVSGLEASWRKNNMFEFSLNDEPEEWIMELFPQNMFFFFFRMGKSAVIFEMKTQLRTPDPVPRNQTDHFLYYTYGDRHPNNFEGAWAAPIAEI